jgi:hypothetical protein
MREELTGHGAGRVLDIGQTNGAALPEVQMDLDGLKGYFQPMLKTVYLQAHMSADQKGKTFAHFDRAPRGTLTRLRLTSRCERIAESAAFAVLHRCGFNACHHGCPFVVI